MPTYTFDPALSTERDWIRVTLGDVDMNAPLVSDEQIAAVRSAALTRDSAILSLAEQVIARLAQEPDSIAEAGITVSYRERLTALRALAGRLRASLAASATAGSSAPTHSRAVTNRGVW